MLVPLTAAIVVFAGTPVPLIGLPTAKPVALLTTITAWPIAPVAVGVSFDAVPVINVFTGILVPKMLLPEEMLLRLEAMIQLLPLIPLLVVGLTIAPLLRLDKLATVMFWLFSSSAPLSN